MKLYPYLHAHPQRALLKWTFPKGANLKFGHLEMEETVLDYQGSEIPFMGFDELTHFTEKQFWYMLSRNRSTSGVKPYIRATTNPDVNSWVRTLIDWWIDKDGYPIPERAGVLRWFIRLNDALIWADSKQEILDKYGKDELPKSLTFIPSKLEDNKILMEKDPGYLANLKALPRVERLRLLGGNWNVRASAGTLFRREWFKIVDSIPQGFISAIRFWDRAASRVSEENKDPDWTRGLKLYRYPNGTFLVSDLRSLRDTPGQVEIFIKAVAAHDGPGVRIMAQKDPGSAGVSEAEHFVKMLVGYDVRTANYSKDKVTRAKPASAQTEAGNIMVLRASWNDEFFSELENFGEDSDGHDDIVDAFSGAFNELAGNFSILDVL